MIVRRILLILAAAAAFAAAAAIFVAALAIALYAWLKGFVGPVGAAGGVALAAALLVGLIGLVVVLQVKGPAKRKGPPPKQGFAERIGEMVRERPIVAAGAAIAAAMVAIRNPALTAIVVKTFLDSQKRPPKT